MSDLKIFTDSIEPEEMNSIWAQLQAAQKMLDAYFEACHKSEDEY